MRTLRGYLYLHRLFLQTPMWARARERRPQGQFRNFKPTSAGGHRIRKDKDKGGNNDRDKDTPRSFLQYSSSTVCLFLFFFYLAFDIFGIRLARKQRISMYEKLALKCEPIIRGRDVGRTTLEVPISTALTSTGWGILYLLAHACAMHGCQCVKN